MAGSGIRGQLNGPSDTATFGTLSGALGVLLFVSLSLHTSWFIHDHLRATLAKQASLWTSTRALCTFRTSIRTASAASWTVSERARQPIISACVCLGPGLTVRGLRAGQVTTLAGSGKAGFSDGWDCAASFNRPVGLAVDSKGRVLVADSVSELGVARCVVLPRIAAAHSALSCCVCAAQQPHSPHRARASVSK